MVNMNEMMKLILEGEENQECDSQIDEILYEIIDKTKIIKNCIIYDKDGTLKEDEINFSKIMYFFGDWTGYEVSCNELIFERQKILPNYFLALAKKLSYLLSQKFDEKKIVIYISLSDDEIDLRFHTYREDERLWLDEDLNKYDKRFYVGYNMVDNSHCFW